MKDKPFHSMTDIERQWVAQRVLWIASTLAGNLRKGNKNFKSSLKVK